ncbi:MAG: Transcription initiation factor TFIID subunit 9 [Icmadophila ericetorum]|nr:Transcription initiation factor TFIID subunit 9 [Icmadophila ericetorum]
MADQNTAASEPQASEAQPINPHTMPTSQPPVPTSANATFPATSSTDNGLSKRPRDARLVHMILANLGVTAYQERVPLQLMDFAYRYTSSTLQDALHLTSETYGTSAPGGGGKSNAANDLSPIALASLRLSIASRTHYQFNPNLPKDFYHDLAQERNRVTLPPVGKESGIRLPPEQYCLTGVGWGLREEWDSEGEEAAEVEDTMDIRREEGEGEDEVDETMEDIFGDGGDGYGDDGMKDE